MHAEQMQTAVATALAAWKGRTVTL
eukprot:SAG11_NODE_25276_length_361_cov_0.648855_1_plen_24_part_01